jgi:hypothetical protein
MRWMPMVEVEISMRETFALADHSTLANMRQEAENRFAIVWVTGGAHIQFLTKCA